MSHGGYTHLWCICYDSWVGWQYVFCEWLPQHRCVSRTPLIFWAQVVRKCGVMSGPSGGMSSPAAVASTPDLPIARPPDRFIGRSSDRPIARPPDHFIARSSDRPIARPPDRFIARSSDRPIAWSPDHLCNTSGKMTSNWWSIVEEWFQRIVRSGLQRINNLCAGVGASVKQDETIY